LAQAWLGSTRLHCSKASQRLPWVHCLMAWRQLVFLLLPTLVLSSRLKPRQFLSAAEQPGGKVKFTAVVETLCPGCLQWISEGFGPMAKDPKFKDRVEVELLWYGNAHWNTSSDQPQCQHGQNECVGNVVMECAKEILSQDAQLEYSLCVAGSVWPLMKKAMEEQAAAAGAHQEAAHESSLLQRNLPGPTKGGICEKCAMKIPEVKKAWSEISSCATSQRGVEAMRRAKDATIQAQHMHTPWVMTYDKGAFGWDLPLLGAGFVHQPEAESNPMAFACLHLAPGERPDKCKSVLPKNGDQHLCSDDHPCMFTLPSDESI